MSTKTTFKRVALVVVAALGFGVLTSVAPASAAPKTASSIVVGTVPTGRVGVTSYVPVTIYLPSITTGDTLNINAEITSAPLSGGAANAASQLGGSNATAYNDGGLGLNISQSGSSITWTGGAGSSSEDGRVALNRANGVDSVGNASSFAGPAAATRAAYVVTDADVAAGYIADYVAIKPDVAGSYSVMVSATNFAAGYGLARTAVVNELYNPGDISASFTITTAGAPTSATLTQVAGGTIHAGSAKGVPVAVTLNGTLAELDSIDLTTSGSGSISLDGTTYATTRSLTFTNFAGGATAVVWLRDTGAAAATISLTATSSGALAAFSASKTFSVQAATGSATPLVNDVYGSTTTYGDASGALTGSATPYTLTVATTSTGQTLGWSWAGAAATKGYVTVTDTAGTLTGIANLTYDQSYALAAADEGLSLSFAGNAVGLVAGTLYSVVVPVASATTTVGMAALTTYNVVSAAKNAGTFTITPTTGSSSYQVAPGAGIAMTAQVKDEFGAAWSGKTVTITTSGRNNPVATTAVTDASGKVTFTSADTSTSTTNLVDTVTFTSTSPTITAKSITLNYGNTAPSTVLLTAGSTTLGVTSLTTTYLPIAAGKAGPSGTLVTLSATVADASGNSIAGTPVTWTIAGTGCAIPTNKVTSYTAATGIATSSAYGWIAGTCTVTATAGTKTGTASLTWRSETASQARTVSATVSGTVVTATVKDRFGNGVKGVTVYATKSGAAYFGAGIGRTTAITDANGNAEFSVAGGSASVTVSVIDYDAAAGATFGQTCALAGNHTCATASTAAVAFTATTVGTATTAETGVGASFAPAGVASATVAVEGDTTAQTAADAAAEATDAANAATDAANAAAEAADAATAAAQDAADAVAALSAQVATLISGLKSQLTALTNLVIKIQKKVKA
jgi:hypothetical protein